MMVLGKSGVFHHYLQTWRDKPITDHTWVNFQEHFGRADIDRKLTLTIQAAGYHGAHMATTATKPQANSVNTGTKVAKPTDKTDKFKCGDTEIFYCHTHGVNLSHTSDKCNKPGADHRKQPLSWIASVVWINFVLENPANLAVPQHRPTAQRPHRNTMRTCPNRKDGSLRVLKLIRLTTS